MRNTDSFTNILNTCTEKIKHLKDNMSATQWINQMTDRVQAMEQENEKAATSFQHYEIFLQKAEHNMRTMKMSVTQAILKMTRSEESILTLQSDVQQLREQIARLERTSHEQKTTHNNIVYPTITRPTLL
jgi:flagellin-like hook-associated protein FlgL